jgi:hypothetical protein
MGSAEVWYMSMFPDKHKTTT